MKFGGGRFNLYFCALLAVLSMKVGRSIVWDGAKETIVGDPDSAAAQGDRHHLLGHRRAHRRPLVRDRGLARAFGHARFRHRDLFDFAEIVERAYRPVSRDELCDEGVETGHCLDIVNASHARHQYTLLAGEKVLDHDADAAPEITLSSQSNGEIRRDPMRASRAA